MSAIAQPAVQTAGTRVKQPSAWHHLKTLVPYVRRYKGMTGLGLLTLTLMGLVGALPQLIIGAITDCLKDRRKLFQHSTDSRAKFSRRFFRFMRRSVATRWGFTA